MKIKVLTLGILLSLNAFSANTYNVLITKEHNKFDEGVINEPTEPEFGEICKIQFKNMYKGGTWGATLAEIELYTKDGIYDYGDITTKVDRTETHFDNMELNTTSTYSNGILYQPEYAFVEFEYGGAPYNYWLATSAITTYAITFPNGADIESIDYSDWGRSDSYGHNYKIQVFDCDDVLLRDHAVVGRASSYHREVISHKLSDLDLPE